jgi:hypothetical protein
MWNDEGPRESNTELRQIAASWILAAAVLVGCLGWLGVRALVNVADAPRAMQIGDDAAASTAE